MSAVALRSQLRDSRALILFELAAVAAIYVADSYGLIVFSKTLYLLVLIGLSMLVRGVGWRSLSAPVGRRWPLAVLGGVVAGALMSGLELFVTQPLLVRLTGEWPDLSDFTPLIGDVRLFLIYFALCWTLAAVGEEVVHRGYLLNRFADLFGRTKLGWAVSLVLMSAAFALAHEYQGFTGMAENAVNGLLLGLIYLASGRNLLAPIVAHGVQDTVDLTLIFFGAYPGM